MANSLSTQIKMYLLERKEDWVPKGNITAVNFYHESGKSRGAKYLPETVGRTLRTLEEDRIIAVKPCGISVQYKYLPIDRRPYYIPSSARLKGNETTLFRK